VRRARRRAARETLPIKWGFAKNLEPDPRARGPDVSNSTHAPCARSITACNSCYSRRVVSVTDIPDETGRRRATATLSDGNDYRRA